MSYRVLETKGVFLPVIEAHCRYRKPAFYDDILTIMTIFRFSGPARLRFDYEVVRDADADLLATGYTVHVCVDAERNVLKPPPFLAQLLQAKVVCKPEQMPEGEA
jgi:acyl-CoA thioester hydrolase